MATIKGIDDIDGRDASGSYPNSAIVCREKRLMGAAVHVPGIHHLIVCCTDDRDRIRGRA